MNALKPTKAAPAVTAVFGAVSILSVAYFESRVLAISTVSADVAVAYLSFIVVMTGLAYFLSGWYLPETGYFEAIALPVLLPTVAALAAGQSFAVYVCLFGESGSEYIPLAAVDLLAFGFFASGLFLYGSWPVWVVFGAAGSWLLFMHFGRKSGYAET